MHNMTPREVVEYYYDKVWSQRCPEAIPSLFAEEYVNHAGARGTLRGPAGIEHNYRTTLAAFPDVAMRLDAVLSEGDQVVARYTMLGTHQDTFLGIAATGAAISVPGIGIYRVDGGKIRESWVVRDALALLKQLGAA
ncbi:putative ester cyclase [Sodalis praecaptivus]|uniref:Putative ester cyclase n=1 Tax=Sodalis praecaptivus TaxID=1239307 RepID=W0HS19_9GAMM|nr:ester cyclase [Sodalis praecaptivus]AHF76626.1 putative ester cyclase [Sodalis praecaptivus]